MEANDLSSVISAITSDPAMMSRVMGALSSLSAGDRNEISEDGYTDKTAESESAAKASARPLPAQKSAVSDRKRLLLALKPYLNQSRREKADMLINVISLLDSGVLNMLGKGE